MTRLFAAIPIPEDVRGTLEASIGDLERLDWPVRWLSGAALHLTVKFYGEVEDGRRVRLERALVKAVQNAPPLSLSLGEWGVFPQRRRPSVVWIGVEGPPALELLHHEVERWSIELGFPSDRPTYRPHVTVGRVRRGATLPDSADTVLDSERPPIPFLADRLVLYRSELSRAGAEYHPELTLPFEGSWAV